MNPSLTSKLELMSSEDQSFIRGRYWSWMSEYKPPRNIGSCPRVENSNIFSLDLEDTKNNWQ